MNKVKLIALAALGTLAISATTSSFAICPLPMGWYGEADAGYTKLTGKNYTNSSSIKTDAPGWQGAIGYKFNPYVAAEASYSLYADTRIRNSLGVTAARDKHRSVNLTSKFMLPIKDTGFELFAKVGLSQIKSKIGRIDSGAAAVNNMTFDTSNKTSVGPFWGVGGEFYFTPNVAGVIQYQQARGSSKTGNLAFASVGLSLLV